MDQNSRLEDMGSDKLSSKAGELEGKGGQKISVSDNLNGLPQSSIKSDNFVVVEMERFSHLIEKDINVNSRITLQRNFSRKGSVRGDKKISSIPTANERDDSMLATSPRATLYGGSTPEKPVVVALGATDHSIVPQPHHQITITNGSLSNTAVESKSVAKKFSFRRSPPSLIIYPRRILLFFATLSSIGTILLIYFTLSMSKLSGDDNVLN